MTGIFTFIVCFRSPSRQTCRATTSCFHKNAPGIKYSLTAYCTIWITFTTTTRIITITARSAKITTCHPITAISLTIIITPPIAAGCLTMGNINTICLVVIVGINIHRNLLAGHLPRSILHTYGGIQCTIGIRGGCRI
ncbi:MAG: hypothetical protein A4E71_01300 [Smithella sp. PtaU1.Bin162]|nr:MAG: hypothetical protein A4E71_01300 [Smithella sp. PtaU1.Bin162]